MAENDFKAMSLQQLADASMQAALALDPDKRRSPEGQAQLHARLRLLLIALGHRICPDFFQASVAQARSDAEFQDGGMDWLERRAREGRYHVLLLSAERRLGAAAERWMREARIGEPPVAVYGRALTSDDGLREVLAAIPARWP